MGRFLLVVNGKPGSGKDTFAELLSKYTTVYKWSVIDPVKAAAIDFGWKGGKTEEDRKFLADLKKILDDYSDFTFEETFNKIMEFDFGMITDDVMVVDMREPNDIDRAVELYDAITVYIKNDNVPEITSNHADAATGEDAYDYDYIINNSGTMEEFEQAVQLFYYLLEMGEEIKNQVEGNGGEWDMFKDVPDLAEVDWRDLDISDLFDDGEDEE